MKRSASTTPAAPIEAAGHQSLSAYIQARFDEFSRSQKDVAQYIVDHLDEVAFQTAEELARRANTSSSTVVRFSQALGFEGFPELQQAVLGDPARLPRATSFHHEGRAYDLYVAAVTDPLGEHLGAFTVWGDTTVRQQRLATIQERADALKARIDDLAHRSAASREAANRSSERANQTTTVIGGLGSATEGITEAMASIRSIA